MKLMKPMTCLVAVLMAGTVYAQAPSDEECNDPTDTKVFPAGVACADFGVNILACEVQEDFKKVDDKLLQAGRAVKLIVTRTDTDESLVLHPRGGSLVQFEPNMDVPTRLVVSGVNLITLYPTDIPRGPSMTLHQGRVDITIDSNGDWTETQVSGNTTDICAALSGLSGITN